MIYGHRKITCAVRRNLVRGIANNSVKFHRAEYTFLPKRKIFNAQNKFIRLKLQGVDKIMKKMSIDVKIAEAGESAFSDSLSHRSFTNDEDIIRNSLVPNFTKCIKREGIFILVTESGSVNAVSDIKRVQAGFGINLKNFGVDIKEIGLDITRGI